MPTELEQNPRFSTLVDISGDSAIPFGAGRKVQGQPQPCPDWVPLLRSKISRSIRGPETDGTCRISRSPGVPPCGSMEQGVCTQREERSIERKLLNLNHGHVLYQDFCQIVTVQPRVRLRLTVNIPSQILTDRPTPLRPMGFLPGFLRETVLGKEIERQCTQSCETRGLYSVVFLRQTQGTGHIHGYRLNGQQPVRSGRRQQ